MYYTKNYGWVTRAEHLALIRAEHTYEKRKKANAHESARSSQNTSKPHR